jgi:CRISPR-associated RAMP protein (TIGR02581 family)
MLKRLVNEAKFTLTITTTGPVLVRSGRATVIGPDMTPVLTFRHGKPQVYLPGSSLKGVVRSHLEKVSRTLRYDPFVVCNPFQTDVSIPDASCGKKLEGRKKELKKQEREKELTTEVAYKESCPICRLFGSTEFTGRVSINDAYLTNDAQPLPTEQRDGVGIDRLTSGSAHGALFQLEVVSSGVEFQTDVYLRNFETWQLGMLLLVVQDMEDGLIRIGSGTSRGLGSVKGDVSEVTINHLGALAKKSAQEVWGLGKFLNNGSYGTLPTDMLTLNHAPSARRRGIRWQSIFKGQALHDLRTEAIDAFINRLQRW